MKGSSLFGCCVPPLRHKLLDTHIYVVQFVSLITLVFYEYSDSFKKTLVFIRLVTVVCLRDNTIPMK